uniref:Uncharacterized protein n=1 Tax=Arundo donax TaxID=35708 RepID=A0A0A9BBV8_ARUDO
MQLHLAEVTVIASIKQGALPPPPFYAPLMIITTLDGTRKVQHAQMQNSLMAIISGSAHTLNTKW